MQHKANSMSASDSTNNSNSEDVWFFDSDASNHMKSHEEWFSDMCTPNQLGYVETRHDTTHPIWHIGDALFGQNGKNNNICLARSDHNEEFGLNRPNRGARHASLFHQRRLLYRKEWSTHSQRTERRLNCLFLIRTR